MTAPDILAATGPVADALEDLGVAYHVGGSVASSVYGVARATLDVDLVADLDQDAIRAFVERLEASYYVDEDMIRDAVTRRSSFNVIHHATMLKVDVFVLADRPFEQEAFSRRREDTLDDHEGARVFPIASAEDTVLHKLLWYRKGGGVSERQWHDVLGVLRVQGDALDRSHMDRWAAALDLEELLARARREAG